MSTCDQDGLIQFWNISSSIPTPLWTYSDGVNIPICSSVNRDYVIIGTMLGKLLGKVGCVFPMVISFEFRIGLYRDHEQQFHGETLSMIHMI